MLGFFLNNAEDTGWRLASFLTTRYWRSQDPAVGAVDRDLLAAQRHDGHDRLLVGDTRGHRRRQQGRHPSRAQRIEIDLRSRQSLLGGFAKPSGCQLGVLRTP